jgi:hypothetical protein
MNQVRLTTTDFVPEQQNRRSRYANTTQAFFKFLKLSTGLKNKNEKAK